MSVSSESESESIKQSRESTPPSPSESHSSNNDINEDPPSPSSSSSSSAPFSPTPNNEIDNDDDDFDDDFGDFEEAAIQSDNNDNNTNTDSNSTPFNSAQLINSKTITQLSPEELNSVLPPSPTMHETDHQDIIKDSPTCSALWQKLTEVSASPLPKWSSTLIHKKLAIILGLPLNLDDSLPNKIHSVLRLPGSSPSNAKLPEFDVLSRVTSETVNRMSTDELIAHINSVESAIQEASKLRDSLELKEMDLKGEKSVLEGMVESLLVFSQKAKHENIRSHLKPTRIK